MREANYIRETTQCPKKDVLLEQLLWATKNQAERKVVNDAVTVGLVRDNLIFKSYMIFHTSTEFHGALNNYAYS